MIRGVLRLWTALRALYAGSRNRHLGRLNQGDLQLGIAFEIILSVRCALVNREKFDVGAIMCARLCPGQIMQAWFA